MRLIDADEIKKKAVPHVRGDNGTWSAKARDWAVLVGDIDDAPTVDAVEVVHGEWSTIEDDCCGLTALQCSKCNQEYWFEDDPPLKIYNYCPNCGAKMDGGNE